MYEWFDLDEAAAILTDTMGKPVGARDLLRMAFAGELRMSSVIPGWESPGVGDLVFYAPPPDSDGNPNPDGDPDSDSNDTKARVSARMASVTDGFFRQLGRYDFQALRNHGRLPLTGKKVRLPDSDGNETVWVIGPDAPTITLDDLRVSAAELERIRVLPTKARPIETPESVQGHQDAGQQDSARADWKAQARAIADEFDAAEAKALLHDSMTNIANRVAARMRELGIQGKRGPVSGGTVMREALQGGKWKRKNPIR